MKRHYLSQLKAGLLSAIIASAGGKVYVTTAGGTAKLAITDKDGAALANPLALVNGKIDFWTADTVASVDLYIQSPTGHFVVSKGIKPSGDSTITVDTTKMDTIMVIPFNAADQAGDATETPCGFTLPGMVQPGVAVDVVTIHAAKTILFGTLSTAAGDADGFGVGISVATAGLVKATLTNGAVTTGAKLFVQDSANAGDAVPEQNTSEISHQVSYTLSAGTTTAAGFLVLPVRLRPSTL